MNDEEWLRNYLNYLASLKKDITAEDMAFAIHAALEIAEAEKYATAESRFTFVFSGASEEDVAEIRKHLTPFENSIVKIERKISQ